MRRRYKIMLAGALAAIGMSGSAASAATLIIVGGELTGARNVDVNGTHYDLSFQDGTCQALFSGCDEPSDFSFNSLDTATSAAQALLDQVFIGNYDQFPELTSGCENLSLCQAVIPYSVIDSTSVLGMTAINWGRFPIPTDSLLDRGWISAFDFREFDSVTFAAFSPAANPIPEPATWAMMIVGFGAIGAGLRGRRQRERLNLTFS